MTERAHLERQEHPGDARDEQQDADRNCDRKAGGKRRDQREDACDRDENPDGDANARVLLDGAEDLLIDGLNIIAHVLPLVAAMEARTSADRNLIRDSLRRCLRVSPDCTSVRL